MNKRFKDLIYKKDGSLKMSYRDAIKELVNDRMIYPKKWTGAGRRKSLQDRSSIIRDVLDGLKLRYALGNDAPRGGAEGDYIKVSSVAVDKIRALLSA